MDRYKTREFYVSAQQMPVNFLVENKHGEHIEGSAGDFLVLVDGNYVVMTSDEFHAAYVRAQRPNELFDDGDGWYRPVVRKPIRWEVDRINPVKFRAG